MPGAPQSLLADTLSVPRRFGGLVAVLALTIGALIGLHPGFAALVIAAWIPLVLTGHLRFAVYLLALSLAFNFTVVSQPIHLSLTQLVGLVLVVAAGIRIAAGIERSRSGSAIWPWSGFIFTAAAMPSLVFAVSGREAVIGIVQLLFVSALIYATTRVLSESSEGTDETLRVLAVAAVLSTVPALLQSALGIGPESYIRSGLMRAYSTYGQPNSYGYYLAGMVPLFLGLATRSKGFLVPLVISSIALLLTMSRGAIAAAVLASAMFLLLYQLRFRSGELAGVVAVLALLGLGTVLVLPSTIFAGLADFGDWSVQQRALTLRSSWLAILDNPVFGYGPGSFKVLRPGIALAGLVDDVEMPHNFLIEVWLELGALALACFVVLVMAYYVASIRAFWRSRDVVLGSLIAAFTGILAASLTGGLLIRGVEEAFVLIVALSATRVARSRGLADAGTVPL